MHLLNLVLNNIESNALIYLLLFGSLTTIFLIVRGLLRFKAIQNQLQRIQDDISSIYAETRKLGNKVTAAEKQLERPAECQNSIEIRGTDIRTFRQAVALARKGVQLEELISTCNLTRGEAELIMVLHRDREYPLKNEEKPQS
ncbi:MAG: DUF2802 domain-containing protein [Thermodesulfobacteriota bacterium]|nr:DUF2802 domain-containing protein [Thermodesulfobacteriota bacterium]